MHKVKNIITIQHPESVHHTNGMIGSWRDWPLTEKGRQQAGYIAFHLKNDFKDKPCSLYSSPLLRAKETADIIGRELNSPTKLSDALKERGLGRAIGKSVTWLKENLEQEELTIFDKCFSDAESRSDVWQRLYPFYTDLLTNDDENIVLVSHGDALSVFNVMWLGLDQQTLNFIDLYGVSGGVSNLRQNSMGKRIIRKLGDTSYISYMRT